MNVKELLPSVARVRELKELTDPYVPVDELRSLLRLVEHVRGAPSGAFWDDDSGTELCDFDDPLTASELNGKRVLIIPLEVPA